MYLEFLGEAATAAGGESYTGFLANLRSDFPGNCSNAVRNKFDANYVLEAMITPSTVISDQYAATKVLLEDGTLLIGIVADGDEGKLVIFLQLAKQRSNLSSLVRTKSRRWLRLKFPRCRMACWII